MTVNSLLLLLLLLCGLLTPSVVLSCSFICACRYEDRLTTLPAVRDAGISVCALLTAAAAAAAVAASSCRYENCPTTLAALWDAGIGVCALLTAAAAAAPAAAAAASILCMLAGTKTAWQDWLLFLLRPCSLLLLLLPHTSAGMKTA
jgi:hypothetical protein